jgi:hypothetical protein
LVHIQPEQSINKGTNFSNAVIDNSEYIQHVLNDGGQNIPNEIKSKQELRLVLEKRLIDEDRVNSILNISDLQ